jgi:hypothetical protein
VSLESVAAWAGIFLCLSQSAMLSGLNLACFSVSRLQLEMEAARNNADAVKVLRFRKDSNFLLTTILWGNVGVNTLLALLSGSVLGGIAAFLFSTVFITVFAEIFPQSYFSRNALRMASLLSPVIRFYQVLLYPVAKPTALILDLWLVPEGVHYVREEKLKQYILTSMGVTGSDIGTFEGKGALNFLPSTAVASPMKAASSTRAASSACPRSRGPSSCLTPGAGLERFRVVGERVGSALGRSHKHRRRPTLVVGCECFPAHDVCGVDERYQSSRLLRRSDCDRKSRRHARTCADPWESL